MPQVQRLIGQCRGPLILIAVAFWWGGVFVTNLFSLAFPELLPPETLSPHLDPDGEGNIVNAISAGALVIAALLALTNAALSRRVSAIAGGWGTLGITCAYLAWEELTDFHVVGLVPIRRAVFDDKIFFTAGVYLWVVLASPLIVAFVVSMGIFVRKALSTQETQVLFSLGITAWLLALAHEASYPFLFLGRAQVLAVLIEESLEFGGTLLFILGAATALNQERRTTHNFLVAWPTILTSGCLAAVGIIGVLMVAFVFRAPVIDARAGTHIDSFHISLRDGESLAQELYMPDVPIGRIVIRVMNNDTESRTALVKLRLKDVGQTESILRESKVEVPANDTPQWVSMDFPSLAAPEGYLLAVHVVAEVAPGAKLQIVGTKVNRHLRGSLSINGSPTWPDQDIEYMVYGAPEPTLSKLRSLSQTLASDWRWPVLVADLALALAFTLFIPAILVALTLSNRRDNSTQARNT